MIDPMGGPAFWWPLVAAGIVGYLIGAIPFGVILTKLAGAGDLRQIGSGNIGATNVLRTGKKSLALAVLVLDALKGAVPAALAFAWFGPDMAKVTALATVVGHCYPVYLRFQGGKGVATAAGVLFALTPVIALVALAAFAVVVALSRYVSLGSLTAAAAAPLAAWSLGYNQYQELLALIALLIVVKHAGNIRRLLKGTENKLGAKKS
ncbi:MAG: glycerol-3-phosphate 1-O-acyltransferase [Geminicoccaceae bacterium]|nr:MAG: glycerol-3-phosphate 1-O-acyltransferase [Geminicoccaceae bacterium]